MLFIFIISILVSLEVLSAIGAVKIFREKPFLKLFLLGFIFIGFIIFILAMFFYSTLPVWLGYILCEVGFDWLISMPLLFIIIYTVLLLSGLRILPVKYKVRAFYTGVFIALLLLVYGRYEYYNIKVVKYDIFFGTKDAGRGSDRKKPVKDGSVKIVAVSDLHLGNYITKSDLSRFTGYINAVNPDVVFFAGDIIDRDITPLIEQNMAEEFARIQPSLGKYLIAGNHEGYGNSNDAEVDSYYRKAGFTVLRDSVVLVDSLFYLIGRDDRNTGKERMTTDEIIDKYISDFDNSIPVIILDHRPMTFEEQREKKAEKYTPLMVLSGHTHNGQVFPFNAIVKNMYPHYYGRFREGYTHYITTSGLGLWGPKFRLGTQSEIIEIDLHYASGLLPDIVFHSCSER